MSQQTVWRTKFQALQEGILTIVDHSCEEMVDPMHSNVDWEEKAHYNLICKHYCCLHHMEAVACEGRRHIRPAIRKYMMRTPFIIPGQEHPGAVALCRWYESFGIQQQALSGAVAGVQFSMCLELCL